MYAYDFTCSNRVCDLGRTVPNLHVTKRFIEASSPASAEGTTLPAELMKNGHTQSTITYMKARPSDSRLFGGLRFKKVTFSDGH